MKAKETIVIKNDDGNFVTIKAGQDVPADLRSRVKKSFSNKKIVKLPDPVKVVKSTAKKQEVVQKEPVEPDTKKDTKKTK